MQRRDVIRLVGGGTLAATLPLLGACSSAPPAEAVAAWTDAPPDTDLRRWALAHAILSPNSHNRQPWLVDLREPDAITLYVDRERLLPETDPWFRQIMVSQGTFLETLRIALGERGVAAQLQLFPQGEPGARTLDDRPVARLAWPAGSAAAATAATAKDPLFAQIRRRHTAKVAYDTTRPVAPSVLATLNEAAALPGGGDVRFGGTVDAAALPPLRTLCMESARVELSTPRTVMESLRLTRVGPAEINRHRDGISVNGAFPRLMAALGLFDLSQPPAPGSSAYKAMFERFEEHSRTAMGFVWLSTPVVAGATRAAEVRAGMAYQRLQLKATEIGLQVHPMSQAPQEFAEMAAFRRELQQRTIGRPAEEVVVQMFCRIGYCEPTSPSPRRELASFIRSA